MGKLTGKTALITGGNSGIGYATAKLFLQEGASVIITGRNQKALDEAVKNLGNGATGILSDAGKMSDINQLEKKLSAVTSKIDVLFANAGVAFFTPFAETTEESFDEQMSINFKGVFFTIQKLLPLLPQGSNIILNSSIVAHAGLATSTTYSASKGAVLSLAKTLATELAEKNIRVNTISPGPINTPIYSKLGLPEDAVQQLAADIQAKVPLKRFGSAEDVASVALFLASADSSFITGTEVIVDGGKAIAF